MRVCLFTDTLGDINGVSRFIRNIAEQSLRFNRSLTVVTSTRFAVPDQPNIVNVAPVWARPMPRYENLEIVWAPRRRLFAVADQLNPDAVHVSTPGPVGIVGRSWALKNSKPLLGTYHTDFPAYIDHLFDDVVLTRLCTGVMRWFYQPFDRIFTRSSEYAQAVAHLGVKPSSITRLLPGIDTDTFHTRYRDVSIWDRLGIPRDGPKVLYVGRVSVEKNLPLLTRVWPAVVQRTKADAAPPTLVVVGDGPYRAEMQHTLAGMRSVFLGFRHGAELSTIYASADLFAFPSTTDTLGQVVMEAQSAGLPVLVTDQGGPASVVNAQGHASQTGYVLPADDVGAWVNHIVALCRDPSARARMGAFAHAKIQPMGIRASFEHFWDVHHQVCNERRPVSQRTPRIAMN